MTIKETTYVGFRGNAREALHFYREVFGGEFQIMDWPDNEEKLVMHGHLTTAAGWDLMCADNPEMGAEDSGLSAHMRSQPAAVVRISCARIIPRWVRKTRQHNA